MSEYDLYIPVNLKTHSLLHHMSPHAWIPPFVCIVLNVRRMLKHNPDLTPANVVFSLYNSGLEVVEETSAAQIIVALQQDDPMRLPYDFNQAQTEFWLNWVERNNIQGVVGRRSQ